MIQKRLIPMRKKKICVVWVSRHSPLPAQIARLHQLLGDYEMKWIRGKISTAEELVSQLKKLAKKYERVIVIPVLPLSIIMRIHELSREDPRFELWFAKMNCILTTQDRNEAKRVLDENKYSRTCVEYADGTLRVFEFEDFYKIKEVRLVLERVTSGGV